MKNKGFRFLLMGIVLLSSCVEDIEIDIEKLLMEEYGIYPHHTCSLTQKSLRFYATDSSFKIVHRDTTQVIYRLGYRIPRFITCSDYYFKNHVFINFKAKNIMNTSGYKNLSYFGGIFISDKESGIHAEQKTAFVSGNAITIQQCSIYRELTINHVYDVLIYFEVQIVLQKDGMDAEEFLKKNLYVLELDIQYPN